MVQPPLDQHYIVIHQCGAKRVNRRCDGAPVTAVAEPGSLTIVPAGTSYVWKTEGPIGFAHLYLNPQSLERIAEHAFDHGPFAMSLIDRVACRDPVLELVLKRMLVEVRRPGCSILLLDSLLESFCVRLSRCHMARPLGRTGLQGESLAPHRLRRVLDYIDEHLADDIALADIAFAAGSSQFHFSRAFRLATGISPYRYLVRRRMEKAKVLLLASGQSLDDIGASCGFRSRRQFATMFKQATGVGPKRFRLSHS